MKLVFAHDHIFYKYNNVLYSPGGLSKEALERYTSAFDTVDVISRQIELNEFNEKLTMASSENVEFTSVPNFKTLKSWYKLNEAKQIVKNAVLNSDYVIARLPSSIGNLAIKYAKKFNIPYLIEVVACPWDALRYHSFKGRIIAPFAYDKMRRLVKEAKYTIYVTERFLQQRYPTKGSNINCSNVALLEFDEDILNNRKKHISNKNAKTPIIIGTAAAVDVKHKGQQYVIKALAQLKSEGYSNIQYQLIGGGNQEFLKKLAIKYNVADQVVFLGTLPHDKVFDWLDLIDIYIQPSRQEGLPRALIEAMSRALPAIGAKTAGIPELIDSKYIFSNTKTNIDEICSLLKSYDKKSQLEQSSRNYIESQKYKKSIIEERRGVFFELFKKNSTLP